MPRTCRAFDAMNAFGMHFSGVDLERTSKMACVQEFLRKGRERGVGLELQNGVLRVTSQPLRCR